MAELHAEQLNVRPRDGVAEDEFEWRITNVGAVAVCDGCPTVTATDSARRKREISSSVPQTLTRSGAPVMLWAFWNDGTGSREKELLRHPHSRFRLHRSRRGFGRCFRRSRSFSGRFGRCFRFCQFFSGRLRPASLVGSPAAASFSPLRRRPGVSSGRDGVPQPRPGPLARSADESQGAAYGRRFTCPAGTGSASRRSGRCGC